MSEAEPPDLETRRDWLRRVFPGLREPLLSEAAEHLELIRVPAGMVVVRQGDDTDGIYILVRGSVSVARKGRAGQATTMATLGPGQIFGEMASLAGVRRTATVSAKTDLDALKLDLEGLCRVVERPLANEGGPGALPGSIQKNWMQVVRSACYALVASHHAVKSIDVLGRPAIDDNPATLLQLTDLARRAASEYGVQVRVNRAGHRPVLHLTTAAD